MLPGEERTLRGKAGVKSDAGVSQYRRVYVVIQEKHREKVGVLSYKENNISMRLDV